jgi:hypothetical protein
VTARQRASRRRRIGRAARRAAERMIGRQHQVPQVLSAAEFAAKLVELGVRSHVGFDSEGNVQEVAIDPDRFAAEVARFDVHPHDDGADVIDLPIESDTDDGPADDGLYDDCPICRALRVSAIGPVDRRWSLD